MSMSGFSCPQVIMYCKISSQRVSIKIISEPLKPAVRVMTLDTVQCECASLAKGTQNTQGEIKPAGNELTESN